MYMLDTNVCIDMIRNRSRQLINRVKQNATKAISVSMITVAELQHGVAKSSDSDSNRVALVEFLVPFGILPFDQPAARSYGEIRHYLQSNGTPIGPLDTLIAAHAVSKGLILVTNNLKEFERVPGLRVENWMA